MRCWLYDGLGLGYDWVGAETGENGGRMGWPGDNCGAGDCGWGSGEATDIADNCGAPENLGESCESEGVGVGGPTDRCFTVIPTFGGATELFMLLSSSVMFSKFVKPCA